jgi:ATP-dependent helicase/DNAse subunit B
MDRGSLVHETLDAFLAAVLARPGGAPEPDAAWTVADRELMHDLAETRMAVYEAHGRTGRRLFWHRDRRRILAELDRFLDADDTVRAEWGMRPIATELRFGFADGARPVDLQLSDGRALRFRGAADRIDVTGTGALWIVDYKTGNPNRYRLSEVDPTAAGTMLQLPVYAHAARASFGTPDTPVSAAYWLVSTRGKFELEELELDDAVDRRVDEVLRAIADGIGGGLFPCRVDPPSSWGRTWRSYTDPDARGTRDRYREWLRKREAPELRGYVALAEPDVLDADVEEAS